MKTSILSKSILVLAVMFLCNLAMSAASPREYMYDTKEENGKVISKVIFLNDNGLLNKEVQKEEGRQQHRGQHRGRTQYQRSHPCRGDVSGTVHDGEHERKQHMSLLHI